jgi:hypothetical protein
VVDGVWQLKLNSDPNSAITQGFFNLSHDRVPSIAHNQKIYLFEDGKGKSFDPVTHDGPIYRGLTPRHGHVLGTDGQRVYIIGGMNNDSGELEPRIEVFWPGE